jgi:pimeloyl-ACP methyl ester carboxylesterase
MRFILAIMAAMVIGACEVPDQAGPQPAAPDATESGFVELDQSRLYYEVKGRGMPVVLIHGGMLDCTMWDPQFDVLAERYRVVRYDASGHGRSATPPDAYFDHQDLEGLMAHLGLERAILVGLSMGGRIAIDFALENPDKVAAVVAVGPGLGGFRFDSEEARKGRPELIEAWGRGEWDRVVELFQRSWTDGPHRTPEEVDPVVREKVREMCRRSVEGSSEGRTMSPPAIERLEELQVPMLVVVGELDMPDIHEIAGLLTSADPNAAQVVIEGVAHMVNMERPEEFNRVVSEYLEGVPAF